MVADDPAVVAASCDYGGEFVAVLERGRMAATQFHPEKSAGAGLRLIKNFIETF
jgi:glutamine amidotransferase